MSSALGVRPTWMDLELIDALLRAQLVARRGGVELVVRDPPAGLRELLELSGLEEALGVEPRREPEGGEERGIDVVLQPRDPAR